MIRASRFRAAIRSAARLRNVNASVSGRYFSTASAVREVSLFGMPSMSPTMEEGGIVEWKFKAGDKFSAGDVLLDIETDKAEISVEAADDGVMAKVLVDNGSKGIPVGQPIAVLAEEGDDLSSINYDALLSSQPKNGKQESKQESKEESKEETKDLKKQHKKQDNANPSDKQAEIMHGKHGTEPLPTAQRLMHEHHIDASEVYGTGPFNRITKGDVLAYLGDIPKDYVVKEAKWFEKLEKMDLTNIELAPKTEKVEEVKQEKAKPLPLVTRIAIPINAECMLKVNAAKRTALRRALLSLRPRPSVLRDRTFLDLLTAPRKQPFTVETDIVFFRGRPVSLEVEVEEPPAAESSPAVAVYIEALKAELE